MRENVCRYVPGRKAPLVLLLLGPLLVALWLILMTSTEDTVGSHLPEQITSPRVTADKLETCVIEPTKMARGIFVNLTEPASFREIQESHTELEAGGRWRPGHCMPTSKVAIVVPYRAREKNLKIFLRQMHSFLQQQLIEYQIFIAEQNGDTTFNRGLMRNIGFVEANKVEEFDCVVFHDVDLYPQDLRNFYHCPLVPRHMCVAIDTRRYRPLANKDGYKPRAHILKDGTVTLSGGALFGGVVEVRNGHFRSVNGYSNFYFGWGGEDDDLLLRLQRHGLWIERPSGEIGRYVESLHSKDTLAKGSAKLYNSWGQRVTYDGLTSLNYTLVKRELFGTHTWILVDIDEASYRRKIQEFLSQDKTTKE